MNERTVLRPSLARLESLELSSTEAFVFTQIDGSSPLADVADSTGVPLEQVITIAKRLEALGAVAAGGGGGGAYTSIARRAATARAPLPTPEPRTNSLALVPRRTARDVYSMKIDPGDAFLLSYVDGRVSIAELAEILGYELAKTQRSVEALVAAGALELGPVASAARGGGPGNRRSLEGSAIAAVAAAAKPKPSGTPEPPIDRASRSSRAPKSASPSSEAPRRHSTRAPKAAASQVSSRPPARPPVPASVRPVAGAAAAIVSDTAAEVCDLDAESITKIEAALVGVAGQTHYTILGVSRGVTAKDLRRAYFALAATLHPDRYFRKKLGTYRKKLSEAFQRVTDSYELLRVESKRAEYDATLRLLGQSQEMAAVPGGPGEAESAPRAKRRSARGSKAFKKPSSARMAVAAPVSDPAPKSSAATAVNGGNAASANGRRSSKSLRKPSSAKLAASASVSKPEPASAPVAASPSPSPAPPPPQFSSSSFAPASAAPVVISVGRATAAPVARSVAPMPVASVAAPVASAQSAAASSVGRGPAAPSVAPAPSALTVSVAPAAGAPAISVAPTPAARVAGSVPPTARETGSKADQFLADAQKALIEGNPGAAANLYRLAVQCAPDASSRRYAESGLNEARSMLADTYAKTARTAEKDKQWSAAAASYGKALHLRPNDPELCDRLANALREEGQDLPRATEVAELAVSRAPRRASFRKTLGRIHAEAGSRAKALEHLEGAFAVEPDEETARLIAALRKPGGGKG